MARNDQTGELPSTRTQEWEDLQVAQQTAQQMAISAARGIRSLQQPSIRRHVLRPADPRLARRPSGLQSRIRSLLATHFCLRNPDPFDILNLADGYQRLYQRLRSLNRRSFRMVTASVANSVAESGNGDTFGYVRPEEPNTIYLNDGYFSRGGGGDATSGGSSPGTVTSSTGRSVVQAGGDDFHMQESLPVRASVVLHETVHLMFGAAGAVHRAINAGTSTPVGFLDCRTGYPEIRTLNQAMGDAYVWEKFARCVYGVH